MGVLKPDEVGLWINPLVNIKSKDNPCGDDDCDIVKVRVLVSKLGR
jgi:hypothetical protein